MIIVTVFAFSFFLKVRGNYLKLCLYFLLFQMSVFFFFPMLSPNFHISFLFICNLRPDFYTLYVEEPDSSGHSFGPVSAGVSSFCVFPRLNITKNGAVL